MPKPKNTQEQPVLVDREIVTLIRKGESVPEGPARMTGAAALSLVWELTKEAYSLSGNFDVHAKLQRDVVAIYRKS